MSENPEQPHRQTREEMARGFDEEGFFNLRIHADQGPEKLIGCLMTSIDIVKMFYVEQHKRQQQANGIVKPNGVLERFRNKWR